MSKYNDKNRQQRRGDSRWIDKYAIGELDFNDENSQEEDDASVDRQCSGLHFVSFGSGSS